ncbi:lipase [Lithospermum erythrorhizon]|uniref:Lipase n=1 Tax=Lithospermum erythrorhizon TaxID=34254 RepID=A0AAV3RB02_LITER
MMSFEINDRKNNSVTSALSANGWLSLGTEIGLGLTGFGVFFSVLGIVFFFDKGLIAMGNILFFSGVALTIGLKSSLQFFTKRSNYKGTISFGSGFFLVVVGWPIIGMMLESYGFVVLFSGFWPTLAVFLQKIPILGWLVQQPYIRSVCYPHTSKSFPCLKLLIIVIIVAVASADVITQQERRKARSMNAVVLDN